LKKLKMKKIKKYPEASFIRKMLLLFLTVTTFPAITSAQNEPYEIPVVVVKYFPVDGENIDKSVTGDYGAPLKDTQVKVDNIVNQLVSTLENASRYHAYKDSSKEPSLKYKILDTYEYFEPLPVSEKKQGDVFMTDYRKILDRINIEEYVEEKGVKEIWIFGYHGGVVGLWESNMSSPFGDVSNSDRDEDDLPVFSNTYTVYHYNYQRGLSEAVENHMHQIEALINHFDGRDTTNEKNWDQLLFWGNFVGSDASHKIINPGCGWAHYPPNGKKDYDWKNEKYVLTDIEDWKPDGSGERIKINCEKWNCNSLDWFTYWMQSLPGKNNNLTYKDSKLINWWIFTGDFDTAKKDNLKLTK
jgi:hypothetical protein